MPARRYLIKYRLKVPNWVTPDLMILRASLDFNSFISSYKTMMKLRFWKITESKVLNMHSDEAVGSCAHHTPHQKKMLLNRPLIMLGCTILFIVLASSQENHWAYCCCMRHLWNITCSSISTTWRLQDMWAWGSARVADMCVLWARRGLLHVLVIWIVVAGRNSRTCWQETKLCCSHV